MVSLKRFFRSLAIASRNIPIEPVKPEPSLKPEKLEELKEKSKLEKEVEEYVMLPLPETLSLEEMKKLGVKGVKAKKKVKKVKPKIKKRKITKKKVKKKTKKRKPKKPKINKRGLRKQLLTIEKRYEELKKRGYSDEELKVIKDKINKIKRLFP